MEMTQEWIIAFNKKCAEFKFPELVDIDEDGVWGLNVEKVTLETSCEILLDHFSNIFQEKDLKFHSDWNWIMEVRNKILSINSYSSKGQRFTFNLNATTKYSKNEFDKPFKVRIKGVSISYPRPFIEVNSFDEKEAVIQAIDQFIDWYNEQNKL